MTIHPYEYPPKPPKTKIPVPGPSYLPDTDYYSDLSDPVFFNEIAPPQPIKPILKKINKPPKYILLNDRSILPSSFEGPTTSPPITKKIKKPTNPPPTSSFDWVEEEITRLLGPTYVPVNIEDFILHSTTREKLHSRSLENLQSDSSARQSPIPPYQASGGLEKEKSNSLSEITDATAAGFYVPGATYTDYYIRSRVPVRESDAVSGVLDIGGSSHRQSRRRGGSGGRVGGTRRGGRSGSPVAESTTRSTAGSRSPSKRQWISPSKSGASKRNGVSPTKGSPSKRKEVSPSKSGSSKMKEVSPSRGSPSKKVSATKGSPSNSKAVSPSKGSHVEGKGVSPSKRSPAERKGVSPSKGSPSKMKGVSPTKVSTSKNVELKLNDIAIKSETSPTGGTAGSNADPKNVTKTSGKNSEATVNKSGAGKRLANDPANGVTGNAVSSKLKVKEMPAKFVSKSLIYGARKGIKGSAIDTRDAASANTSEPGEVQTAANQAAKAMFLCKEPVVWNGYFIPGHDSSNPSDQKAQKIAADTGHKLLHLCQKGDWYEAENVLKDFQEAITLGEAKILNPLAEISDEETGWSPLMYAIKDNRLPLADIMIELGSDVNLRNKESLTPLHIASLCSQDEMVRLLLLKQADATLRTDPQKENCLHLACARPTGHSTPILKALLSAVPKDSRTQKDKDGNIPLFLALNSGSRGACQQLLGSLAHEQLRIHGGPSKDTALHMAVRKRDLEITRILVDSSANVDARNGEHQTPLHIASAIGDDSLVKFFYLCKANPNMVDKEDRTPISLAATNGHEKVIDLLADKFKVSVFERTRDGSTLMHIASLNGHPETAMALFRKGGGARSLHIAARAGHAHMINSLLDKGEKVDAVTNDNYTALHIAVQCEKPNVVETLLGYGATVHIKGGKAKETPLHIAARVDGGDKCALMLLKSGADPNITMENGETPLHVAARHGRLRIIKLILQDGGNVSHKSNEGETPLHLACQNGHVRAVKEILQSIQSDQGESEVMTYVNLTTNKGETALHYTAKLSSKLQVLTPSTSPTNSMSSITSTSHSISASQKTPAKTPAKGQAGKDKPKAINAGKEIAQMLLEGGAAVNLQTKDTHETPFHYCAREGNNLMLKEMLSRMTVVDCQRALNKQSTKGWSPLLTACAKGHVSIVRTLLESNARVDVFDLEGRSGLHLAAEAGYKEICGILLKNKAFINAKSRVGLTALHLAAMKGYTKLCMFLIQEHGAYVDVGTLKKQTPLHMAASTGQMEVCRLLMGLRANCDATDEQGQKPIHMAAENNHSEIIKLFLKHQNSLASSATKDGSTCAHLAAMQGSISVLEELMKFDRAGVISARNRSTEATALQLAAEGGHADLVKALLEAGASATDENKAGYAAVHLAAQNGHSNVIDTLRAYKAINLSSRKLGLTALHIASFYGQQETCRDLLQYIPATSPSESPVSASASFVKELGTESGLTPLHMGAYSGEENVVRLLLNSAGVQVDAPTTNLGFNPLHLACRGGHTSVVGLLLSRSSELLESKDACGKTSLHIAAVHGHKPMCEILLGQGGEIDDQSQNLAQS